MDATCQEIVDDVVEQVIKFAQSTTRNKWIVHGPVAIYVRNSYRILNPSCPADFKDVRCHDNLTLDIASMDISPEYRGLGIGTELCDAIHERSPHRTTYVESLVNERWHHHLAQDGWHDVDRTEPPCVFKRKDSNATAT
jgi:GNAT superfamily N-acetyltransferase